MRRYRRDEGANWGDVQEGIETLREGGVIVYPTDTLYGLGCSCEECMERVFEIKGRREKISLVFPKVESAIDFLASKEAEFDRKPIKEFLPGPFTFVIWGYGIRVPECEIALSLAKGGGPLTATSANHHNGKPPITAKQACSELGERVDLYIDGGVTRYKGPSTVVEIKDGKVSILRNGVGDSWRSPKGRTIGELAR